MTNKKTSPAGSRRLWIPVLILSLIPTLSCGTARARKERVRNEYFAEILKRVDRQTIGQDSFFEQNLLANPDSDVRRWCALALGRIGSVRALPMLYKAARTGDVPVRCASVFALGVIRDRNRLGDLNSEVDSETVKELRLHLDDPSLSVQMRAVESLGKIGGPAEAAEIARRLAQLRNDGSVAQRTLIGFAITALARLKDPTTFPVLEQLASSRDPEIRRQAMDALARLQDPDRSGRLASPALLTTMGIQGSQEDSGSSGSALTDAASLAIASSRKNSTIAIVETSRGTLEIELFREDAPLTVSDFTLMARNGALDGFVFEEAMVPGRAEAKKAGEQPESGRAVIGEVNMRPFERGSVGITAAGGKFRTGRFFIALSPQPYLDGVNPCIGRVISGIQVADRIVPGDKILHVNIKETISFLDHIRY